MSNLRRRLERLERLEDGDGPCPECGGPWQPGDPIEYIVEWEDDPEPDPLPPCPRCGREREIIIDSWPDLAP